MLYISMKLLVQARDVMVVCLDSCGRVSLLDLRVVRVG